MSGVGITAASALPAGSHEQDSIVSRTKSNAESNHRHAHAAVPNRLGETDQAQEYEAAHP
jgi:hypothetical protein